MLVSSAAFRPETLAPRACHHLVPTTSIDFLEVG